jgi:hypothetical protein
MHFRRTFLFLTPVTKFLPVHISRERKWSYQTLISLLCLGLYCVTLKLCAELYHVLIILELMRLYRRNVSAAVAFFLHSYLILEMI